MERINGPTPSGGDYAELYMFDKDGNITDNREKAVRVVVRECKKDGTLIFETWGEV